MELSKKEYCVFICLRDYSNGNNFLKQNGYPWRSEIADEFVRFMDNDEESIIFLLAKYKHIYIL